MVDSVFEAIAHDYAARSIGVSLSGACSDGTAAVRRIRMVGGFTFAEDATAEQGGMSESAIASG